MNSPGIALCTLALNEMEWLPRLYEQHRHWPNMVGWVFVEAADRSYAQANPEMVSPLGLSVDGTTEWLDDLASRDKRVTVIHHGFCESSDSAQGKCEARNRYLCGVEKLEPQWLISLDADEFYTHSHQKLVGPLFEQSGRDAYILRRREIWHPPHLKEHPLMSYEVVGGFWGIPCCHWWRYHPGMIYKNHNTPEINGRPLSSSMTRLIDPAFPQMIHMGFASATKTRLAKNNYYVQRGEGQADHRAWYVVSRAAWLNWKPRMPLPRGARVLAYHGPVPEIFQATTPERIAT